MWLNILNVSNPCALINDEYSDQSQITRYLYFLFLKKFTSPKKQNGTLPGQKSIYTFSESKGCQVKGFHWISRKSVCTTLTHYSLRIKLFPHFHQNSADARSTYFTGLDSDSTVLSQVSNKPVQKQITLFLKILILMCDP